MARLRHYYLETAFDFGIHKGETLEEVANIYPEYVVWCIINVKWFYIDDIILDQIKSFNSFFIMSKEAEKAWEEKDEWNDQLLAADNWPL